MVDISFYSDINFCDVMRFDKFPGDLNFSRRG